jgi:hypothetical protein
VRVDDFTAPINEIFLIPQSYYQGEWLDNIDYNDYTSNTIPYPGSNTLLLSFSNDFNEIYVLNPKQRHVAAKMSLQSIRFPLPKTKAVRGITVRPEYRNMGMASTLYQIALRSMGHVLVADDVQTTGGARNWLSLSNLPGVEVLGYVAINMRLLAKSSHQELGDRLAQELMQMGGVNFGTRGSTEFYYFAVQAESALPKLVAAVKQKIIKIYNSDGMFYEVGLFARYVE